MLEEIEVNEKTTEKRRYEVNGNKALHRKLPAADRPDVTVKETGGGVVFRFNTGTYELFKFAAELYFKTPNTNSNTRITSVTDKKGNEVETKYNVSSLQKNISYTFTLYHTTSTCLVNGKNTRQFIDSDLSKILAGTEKKLLEKGCSLDNFNKSIKRKIAIHETHDEVVSVEEMQETNVEVASVKESNSNDDPAPCTLGKDESQGLKVSLENHIKTSQTQISQIKDEIVSVKKHVTVMTADTNQTVEHIADQTHFIQTEIVNQADLMQTRLAYVFDSLKTLHVKESNTKNPPSAQRRNLSPESPSYSKQPETCRRKKDATQNTNSWGLYIEQGA